MIRRPPRSTLDRSSAASDVYKRQDALNFDGGGSSQMFVRKNSAFTDDILISGGDTIPVSYTHLRAHETVLDLVCRLLLEKKKHKINNIYHPNYTSTKNI